MSEPNLQFQGILIHSFNDIQIHEIELISQTLRGHKGTFVSALEKQNHKLWKTDMTFFGNNGLIRVSNKL